MSKLDKLKGKTWVKKHTKVRIDWKVVKSVFYAMLV